MKRGDFCWSVIDLYCTKNVLLILMWAWHTFCKIYTTACELPISWPSLKLFLQNYTFVEGLNSQLHRNLLLFTTFIFPQVHSGVLKWDPFWRKCMVRYERVPRKIVPCAGVASHNDPCNWIIYYHSKSLIFDHEVASTFPPNWFIEPNQLYKYR